MLDALKKTLGVTPEAKNGITKLAVPVIDTDEFKELFASFTALQATYEALVSTNAAQLAELEDTKTKLGELETFAEQLNQAKAAAEANAKAVKMAARKTAITEAIGEAQADALLAATEALDDTAFAAVVGSLKGSVAVEANTALFKEVGVDAPVDANKPVESKEMQILRAKYKAPGAK